MSLQTPFYIYENIFFIHGKREINEKTRGEHRCAKWGLPFPKFFISSFDESVIGKVAQLIFLLSIYSSTFFGNRSDLFFLFFSLFTSPPPSEPLS